MGSEIVGPRRVTFKSTSADVGFLAVPRYLHVCQRASLMKCSNAMLSNNSAGSPLLFELCTERVACTSNYRQRTSISSEATTWKKAIEKNKYLSSILLLVTSRVRKIHAVQTQNRTQAEGFFFLMFPNGRKNGVRLSVGLVVSHFSSDSPYVCNVRDLYSNRCRVYLCKKRKKGNRRRDYKRGGKLSGNSLEKVSERFLTSFGPRKRRL